MANYENFKNTDNITLNIKEALACCKADGENTLVFPKGTYNISSALAEQRYVTISNHDNGLRGIIFLLEGFKDFTLDFSGSELIIDDTAFPFAVIDSENITIKNVSVRTLNPLTAEGVVTECSEKGFTFRQTGGSPIILHGTCLKTATRNSKFVYLNRLNAWDKETGYMTPEFPDLGLAGVPFGKITDEEGNVFFNTVSPYYYNNGLKTGDKISLDPGSRESCGIFIDHSKNIKIENFTRHNGPGMGVIAQVSENIEISGMKLVPYGNGVITLGADATHFVHCYGLIHIHDSHFEAQLDDALNVHGIYLRIIDKTEKSILLKYMHNQAQGIDFIKEGDTIETCDPESLIPKKRYKVSSVEKINYEYISIEIEGGTEDIPVGDDVTEVSRVPEVIFENCTLKNNRARGMLLASAGKTVIRNNLFDNPGTPIKFESDGQYWFEAGGVKDVLITGNTFTRCKYVKNSWGSKGLIEVMKRPKFEEGKYYHGKIEVSDNTFIDCHCPVAIINNTEEFIYKGNRFENCSDTENVTEYVGKYITE